MQTIKVVGQGGGFSYKPRRTEFEGAQNFVPLLSIILTLGARCEREILPELLAKRKIFTQSEEEPGSGTSSSLGYACTGRNLLCSAGDWELAHIEMLWA